MRILISGYYGAGNVGDEALLSGLATALTARGHRVGVLSADPPATRELHGLRAFHRVRGLVPAITWAQTVVSGGGGLLQDVTSGRSLDYYLSVLRLARGLGRRVAVYGQSLGPLSAAGRAKVGRVLQGVPLAVRDELSTALARDLGLDPVLVADPALLLALPADAKPADPQGPVVLVPRSGQDQLNAALETLALQLQEDGTPLAAAAFHPHEDAPALDRLVRIAPRLRVLDASTPADALRALGGARYVVSVRLHGCILAARLGVGFAGLSYDPKVKGFLAQAVAPAFQRPVDDRALLNLVRAAPPPAEHATAHLRRLAEEGIDWLTGALAPDGAVVEQR